MIEDKNSIENMWEQSKSVFRNKNVLKVSYVPEKLSDALHREEIIKRYQINLIDVSRGLAPNNIFVFGKSGTGKSLVTKLVLKDLVMVANKKGINVNVININCETLRTENSMWIEINNKMLEINNIINKNVLWNSRSRHAIFFQDLFNKLDGILIIVLDEIDKSADYNIINKLVRSVSDYNQQSPCLICITNDVNFQNCLEAHALSVLAQNDIQIDPYDAEELADILKARVKIAFCPNTVNELVIPLCTALAAQEHGDCRKSISLLAKAGEIDRQFECNHYFTGIHLTGSCFSTGLDYEKPVYENIKTILTKDEFEQLIEFDKEMGKLGFGITTEDERYQKGLKLYSDIQPILNKLKSEENKILFEEIIDEERIWMCEEYDLSDEDIDDIFDHYGFKYRDRGIISAVWDSIEDAAYEEAEALGYVNKQNDRWFNYETFGEDLLDGDSYLKLSSGKIVYLSY